MKLIIIWLETGDTLNIPDSVMGLTFLAAGTSVPEAVSSVIVTNQGNMHLINVLLNCFKMGNILQAMDLWDWVAQLDPIHSTYYYV